MKISVEAFSHIVTLIYAAAVSPEHWDEAVSDIHGAFVAAKAEEGQVRSTTLVFADGVSRSMTGTLSPEADRAYGEHYGPLDYVLQAVERGPVGALRTGTELIGPRTRNEFYSDWVRPNDLGDGIFVRLTADSKPTSFLIAGSPARQSFDNDDRMTLMTLLIPHLQQALQAQAELSHVAHRVGEFTETLDAIEHGIAIVSPGFRIEHVNAEAERLFRDGDGLALRVGHIVTSSAPARMQLEVLLNRALHGDADGVRGGGSIACHRPSGRRPFAVHVLPLGMPGSEVVVRGPAAMVVIVDPDRRRPPSDDVLRHLFGLTKTEVAVAKLVLNGEGLGPIGEQLTLSRDTVKTHMRSIFQKTGTHRQAELVRLLFAVTV